MTSVEWQKTTVSLIMVGLTNCFINAFAQQPMPPVEIKSGEPVNGLQAMLTIQNSTISQGEDLSVELELSNVSEAPFSLYRHVNTIIGMPGYVSVRILQTDGTSVKIIQEIDEHLLPSPEDYIRLEPGTSRKYPLRIPLWQRFSDRGFEALGSGHYELFLEVHFSEEGRIIGVEDAWAGTLLSNRVIFEIK